MPLEKPAYRDNLERIIDRFPDRELLNKKDVIAFTGRSYEYVTKRFPFKNNTISIATLAREMS